MAALGPVATSRSCRLAGLVGEAAFHARQISGEILQGLGAGGDDPPFSITHCLQVVRLVDRVRILATGHGELLQPLLDAHQRAQFLGQSRDPRLQRHDLIGIGGERRTHMVEPRVDLGDPLDLEIVEQHQLRRGAVGDALDFVLAVDVGAKHAARLET